jgi:hypothetical protein
MCSTGGSTVESAPGSQLVWTRLRDDGRPAGDEGASASRSLRMRSRQAVADLIDQIGFDPVDAGTLAEGGRKHQPGGAAYTQGCIRLSCARGLPIDLRRLGVEAVRFRRMGGGFPSAPAAPGPGDSKGPRHGVPSQLQLEREGTMIGAMDAVRSLDGAPKNS